MLKELDIPIQSKYFQEKEHSIEIETFELSKQEGNDMVMEDDDADEETNGEMRIINSMKK